MNRRELLKGGLAGLAGVVLGLKAGVVEAAPVVPVGSYKRQPLTLYVNGDSKWASDDNVGIRPEWPLATIQAAVDSVWLTDYSVIKVLGEQITESVVVSRQHPYGVTISGSAYWRERPAWSGCGDTGAPLHLCTESWLVTGFTFHGTAPVVTFGSGATRNSVIAATSPLREETNDYYQER